MANAEHFEYGGSCGCEQIVDEQDFALNAWLFVMDIAALDCSDRLYPTQGGFGGSEIKVHV